ncbi:chemotaxis protein CheB [Hymenobacter sp. 15J16-1T3B]|uniref:chemotaxis protein CheB n=1 Tax=Hymenobacter sp. 15J16-1T3B TaxID=2886941 RepID=UPI001D12040E|nr:chemotaxis protein CheB [Hymenobacter sp. 15J16-1T3B]MCC3157656.1 chemotaxis protein CheB [Hymenobacter sp. 15J16-1T3B]
MDEQPSLIVIGTSAGGMLALTRLVAQLPATLPAAVLVVQHLSVNSTGQYLVERLAQHTTMQCHLGTHHQPLLPGHLYLAPPDRHMLVKDGHILITKGPHENHYRPAADALFRSAAASHGARVIGVVLTGMLHDGTAGMEFIKRAGGITVVQDPHDAEFSSMPESALRNVQIDHVVPIDRMGQLLQELVQQPLAVLAPVPNDIVLEASIAERVVGTVDEVSQLGHQVPLTCPDCGGSLWEMEHGEVHRYRCHTGHAFTADSLMASTQHHLEESMWVALRMLEERKNLLATMARRGPAPGAALQEQRVEELKTHIDRLRQFLLNGAVGGPRADVRNTVAQDGPAEQIDGVQ